MADVHTLYVVLNNFKQVAAEVDNLQPEDENDFLKQDILYTLKNWIVLNGENYLEYFKSNPNNIDTIDTLYYMSLLDITPRFKFYCSRFYVKDFTPDLLDQIIIMDMSTIFDVEKLGTSFHYERSLIKRVTDCVIC